MEKQQIEASLQREKLAAEDKKLQAELAKQQVDAALQREKLVAERQADEREQLSRTSVTDPVRADGFRLSSAIKFVPHFQDSQTDLYLVAFEKCMLVHKFPKDSWTRLIHTQLNGKALKVFAELSVEEYIDFDVLKKALLLAYDYVP